VAATINACSFFMGFSIDRSDPRKVGSGFDKALRVPVDRRNAIDGSRVFLFVTQA
jgi:hypothetical protein